MIVYVHMQCMDRERTHFFRYIRNFIGSSATQRYRNSFIFIGLHPQQFDDLLIEASTYTPSHHPSLYNSFLSRRLITDRVSRRSLRRWICLVVSSYYSIFIYLFFLQLLLFCFLFICSYIV